MSPATQQTLQISRQFVVPNALGLHARAATKLSQLGQRFAASLQVQMGSSPRVNGKSVLDLLTLGAAQGNQLQFTATGADARELLEAVAGLFAQNLGD
jgi:phosphotransferase system HPr (HPr) family protein